MKHSRLKEQVDTIRQAFGYITRFRDQAFVVHLDSALIELPLFPLLIRDIVHLHRMGIRVALVPGSRKRIDEVLRTYGVTCQTAEGMRITSAEAMPFVKMAAFDVSNRIMTLLAENNVDALIGNWVRARGIGVRKGIDFQNSGVVDTIKVQIVHDVLARGHMPIFPNVGWSMSGTPYNVSSTELAACIGRELGAAKLFFVTASPSLTARRYQLAPDAVVSAAGVLSRMTAQEARAFVELNRTEDADVSVELVRLAHEACRAGVPRVHIVDGRVEGMVLKEIFSERGVGTMIYANQHENIRPMTHRDLPQVLKIMEPLVKAGILIRRSDQDIAAELGNYYVYEVDGTIHGSGALMVYGSTKAGEISSVAVDQSYAGLGIGKRIVSFLIDQAARRKLKRLFLLTTQTEDWFSQLGFRRGKLADLPPRRRKSYDRTRNSRILVCTVPARDKRRDLE